tara:strand:- start:255 stop:509 length:255 start_codon:yes stop_codon:yes gene_type:complete
MGNLLSDHQESNHYAYNRSWDEMETMLEKAEQVRNDWEMKFITHRATKNKSKAIECARNMKALEGVIKTLKWTLGDKNIAHPLN